ncbi:MAG TPA: thioesterase family protein [Candidatus Sumerlaeota bacterium]|nr:thioesterase family protein [Candidatus Sumerlaeota bacterium]
METPAPWSRIENRHDVRVTYRDTDQMGVVYYANYLVWFEIGRTELLRSAGRTYREFEALGLFLPVSRAECRYRKPAKYDEVVSIFTSVSEITRVRIVFHYRIQNHDTGELLAEGETVHAVVDAAGRISRSGHILEEWLSKNSPEG